MSMPVWLKEEVCRYRPVQYGHTPSLKVRRTVSMSPISQAVFDRVLRGGYSSHWGDYI